MLADRQVEKIIKMESIYEEEKLAYESIASDNKNSYIKMVMQR